MEMDLKMVPHLHMHAVCCVIGAEASILSQVHYWSDAEAAVGTV